MHFDMGLPIMDGGNGWAFYSVNKLHATTAAHLIMNHCIVMKILCELGGIDAFMQMEQLLPIHLQTHVFIISSKSEGGDYAMTK